MNKQVPLLIAFTGMLGLAGGLALLGMKWTTGIWVFPLDDPYIHWAIGREVFTSGNWGPSPFQFQLSSSSPLFSLSVGIPQLLGISPFYWTLAIQIVTTFFLLKLWQSQSLLSSLPSPIDIFTLTLLSLLLPLHLLVLLGMEHLLHIYFCCWFLVESQKEKEATPWIKLAIIGMIMIGLRYESLFVLTAFVMVRRSRDSLKTFFLALVPMFLTGGYSLAKGGTFFPISVLGKGHSPTDTLTEFLLWSGRWMSVLYENPFMLSLIFLVLLTLYLPTSIPIRRSGWILLLTLGAHIQLAEVGGFRYEAYLVGMVATLLLGMPIHRNNWRIFDLHKKAIVGLLACFLLLPLGMRTAFFTYQYPTFCQNIYQQPYLVGQFLATYYQGRSVGMNDIGAGSFFAQLQLTDMVGIGDQAVHDIRSEGRYTIAVIDSLTRIRKVQIAVVHDIWVGPIVPHHWTKVATWTIPDNVICADETVSFYAVEKDEIQALRKNLTEFLDHIPPEINIQLIPSADSVDSASSIPHSDNFSR
ncbi:MAG: hypothetical protein AAFP89_22240 [Bacteroidota bacterium]